MRIIVFLVLTILTTPTVFTQNHFANIGSTWYHTIPDPFGGSPFYDFTKYECVKDTIIDTLDCKFISSSKEDHILIYEEDDKVYYLENDELKLLFDFSAAAGDTVYFDMRVSTFLIEDEINFTFIDTTIKVLSVIRQIDTILVDTEYLTRIIADYYPEGDFLVNAIWNSAYIYFEKLGCSTEGMIPLLIRGMGPSIQKNRFLRCYSDSEIHYISSYWEQFGEECDYRYHTGISQQDYTAINSYLYPNPVKEMVNIHLENISKEVYVKIIDLNGLTYLKNTFLLENESLLKLDVGGLKPGMYFILISTSKGELVFNTKFIKT